MKIERLEVLYADTPTTFDADGRDLVAGLGMSPKWIPSHYSYDAKGSELFDKVTEAPAYYLYRRELDVIEARAAEIAELFDGHAVVELGSGAAKKTRTILRALASTRSSLMYQPVDISEEILLSSSRELIHELGSLRIRALAGRYADALDWLHAHADGPRLYVCLGSSVGNMGRPERHRMLCDIRRAMRQGDRLLLGVDLAKDPALIKAAYNTSASDAFILNKLAHINYRFDGDFVIENFEHRAVYDPKTQEAQAHLYALKDQTVRLSRIAFQFSIQCGEHIIAERMFKFTGPGLEEEAAAADLAIHTFWTDRLGHYGVALCTPI